MLASGYLAVLGSGYLDAPTAILVALGMAARALIVSGRLRLHLPPAVVSALTLAYIGFYIGDYFYLSREFVTATVRLVFFLAVVKLLTASTGRDYFYVKVIAFLELLAASILSADANYSLFLALFLVFGVATFASGEILRSARRAETLVRSGQRRVGWRLSGLTASTVLGIFILTAGLFIILPRTARAAFQRLIPERYHLPGFAGEVRLGEIGELKMRDTAVMHVKIADSWQPRPLKWRGAALSNFDGKRWFNASNMARAWKVDRGVLSLIPVEERLRFQSPRLSYEVVMREITSDALFFAGVPEWIQIGIPLVIQTPTDSFRAGFTPDHLRYLVSALVEQDRHPFYRGEPLKPALRAQHLALPRLDPRISQLALEVSAKATSEAAKAYGLDKYLRESFGYTIELPRETSADPIAHFLFERRKGHCEYFASSLAVMLRAVGIPSRVVTGFQSGVYNPLSGWFLIRASDAHSWVEAFVEGRGWITLDPTPPDPNPPSVTFGSRLQLYADAVQVLWQDWVLGYDFERQLTLAARVEQSSRDFQARWIDGAYERWARRLQSGTATAKRHGWKAAIFIALVAAAAMLGPLAWRKWKAMRRVRRVKRGQVSASDATMLYERMLEVMRQRGMEKPFWVTPAEFAGKLGQSESSAVVDSFTQAYNQLRFGQRTEAAARMVALLDRLERL